LGDRQKLENGRREIGQAGNDPIGPQFGRRRVGITVVNGDYGNPGCPSHGNIADGIAHHYGLLRRPAGTQDSASQEVRVGFLQSKGVWSTYSNEKLRECQRIEKSPGEPFQLVCTDRQPAATLGKAVEGACGPRNGPRAICDMEGVMADEVSHEPVEFRLSDAAPLRRETAFDHLPCSAAYHVAGVAVGDASQADAREHEVERVSEIWRAVDQCPVQIENDKGRAQHPRSLPVARRDGKFCAGEGTLLRGSARANASGARDRAATQKHGKTQGEQACLHASPCFPLISEQPVAMPVEIEAQKRAAAARAVEFVQPGMRLGLGSGSTARHFVELLAERVRAGLRVIAVATSEATRSDAQRLGVPLTTLDETPQLDLTVDGADEIAPDLSLIKGGGGALLREKIVASASSRLIVIADESKWVPTLGRFPLPVEVAPFGLAATRRKVEAAAAAAGCPGPALLRRGRDGHAFVTDSGHWILDASCERIPDPKSLADRLDATAGVIEHGLFIGLAHTAVLAGSSGVRVVERS